MFALFHIITQHQHITKQNAMLRHRRLNISKIVTPDFKHAEATFLVERNVLKRRIRRPNQERAPSTPAQFILQSLNDLLPISVPAQSSSYRDVHDLAGLIFFPAHHSSPDEPTIQPGSIGGTGGIE